MTSKDLNAHQKNFSPIIEAVKPNTSKKSKLKCGANIEINVDFLDEVLHNKNLYLEVARKFISNNQAVKNNTVQDLIDFNSQSLAIQAKE